MQTSPTRRVGSLAVLAALTLLSGCLSKTFEPHELGKVTRSVGFPSVSRNSQTYILDRESIVYRGDIVNTNETSRIQISLADGTELALGSDSHLVFHTYRIKEGKPLASIVTAFTRGAIRVTRPSDRAGEKISEAVTLTTPLATVTSKGQDIWAGYLLDDRARSLDVTLLAGSRVRVSNGDGASSLTEAGYGIKVTTGAAPRAPQAWDPKMTEQAIESTRVVRVSGQSTSD
ncbi:MAG: FecR domain-containing protein [Proteobacteria bacterium]|jgi:hypothetical protein|nr:FecR domain-containing protein [Pseudomonadota bacterium]MDA1299846.1 FecR domain-containing protein [Pseudomonadota bacterium]